MAKTTAAKKPKSIPIEPKPAKKSFRVRIALPTNAHCNLGHARLALVNYALAKQNNGNLILRIDDIETTGDLRISETSLIDSLRWLGLDWDEGPDKPDKEVSFKQSERMEIYKPWIDKLLTEAKVYECYCTSDELEYARKQALRSGLPPKYNGKCRFLSQKEKNEYKRAGRKPVLRLKVNEEEIAFDDLVLGELHTETAMFGDFVILKHDGRPMHNFASILDDIAMKVSHIVRSADAVPNTYRQIAVLRQLGIKCPQFAHVPYLLNPDKSKLSKKYGPIDLHELRDTGYVREAVISLVAKSALRPDQVNGEVVTLDDFVKLYKMELDAQQAVVLDRKNLNTLNERLISQLTLTDLSSRVRPFLAKHAFTDDKAFIHAMSLIRSRVRKLDEVPRLLSFLFHERYSYQKEYFRYYSEEDLSGTFKELQEVFAMLKGLEKFDHQTLDRTLDQIVAERQFDGKRLRYTMNISLTVHPVDLPLSTIMELLGKEATLRRLEAGLSFLRPAKR